MIIVSLRLFGIEYPNIRIKILNPHLCGEKTGDAAMWDHLGPKKYGTQCVQ